MFTLVDFLFVGVIAAPLVDFGEGFRDNLCMLDEDLFSMPYQRRKSPLNLLTFGMNDSPGRYVWGIQDFKPVKNDPNVQRLEFDKDESRYVITLKRKAINEWVTALAVVNTLPAEAKQKVPEGEAPEEAYLPYKSSYCHFDPNMSAAVTSPFHVLLHPKYGNPDHYKPPVYKRLDTDTGAESVGTVFALWESGTLWFHSITTTRTPLAAVAPYQELVRDWEPVALPEPEPEQTGLISQFVNWLGY